MHVRTGGHLDDDQGYAGKDDLADVHDEARVGQLEDPALHLDRVELTRADEGVLTRLGVGDADDDVSAAGVGEADCRLREVDQGVG